MNPASHPYKSVNKENLSVKLKFFMTINAFVFIGAGIAFALYGPLMIDLYGILEFEGDIGWLYWYAASFGRMLGAMLFGTGFVIWAASGYVGKESETRPVDKRLMIALLITNGMGLFVAATQQFSVWFNTAGWITLLLFLTFSLGYLYFIIKD